MASGYSNGAGGMITDDAALLAWLDGEEAPACVWPQPECPCLDCAHGTDDEPSDAALDAWQARTVALFGEDIAPSADDSGECAVCGAPSAGPHEPTGLELCSFCVSEWSEAHGGGVRLARGWAE